MRHLPSARVETGRIPVSGPETVRNALFERRSSRPLRTPPPPTPPPSLLVVMEPLNIDAAIIQGHVDARGGTARSFGSELID